MGWEEPKAQIDPRHDHGPVEESLNSEWSYINGNLE